MFTSAVREIRRSVVRHPVLIDTGLGGLLAAPAVFAAVSPHLPDGPVGHGGVGVAALAWLAVACRRLWPVATLVAAGTITVALTVRTGSPQPAMMIALVVVVFTVVSGLERRRALMVAGAVALPLYAAAVVTSSSSWWAPQNLGVLAWVGLATAVGDAVRSRQAYVGEVEERARRAELTREDEARRRVVDERMRIARELHDVVSHHIAVINVQAGAARHVLHRQPEIADTALEHIRRASDTVLRELGSLVGVLRQADDRDDSTEPTRGLARLGDLLDAAAAAGLKVDHEQHGTARELPAVVDLAAYRILQEALTNAQKHGTGSAELSIRYSTNRIILEVTNEIGAPGAVTGYGLVGMRERASSAGGSLHAERHPDRQFRVRAVLPASMKKERP